MKRDVKVGLFVAAVVCGFAAILLGGGLAGRGPEHVPPLRLDEGAALEPPAGALMGEGPGSVPSDLSEGMEPPAEPTSFAEATEPSEAFGRRRAGFEVHLAPSAETGPAGLDAGLDAGPEGALSADTLDRATESLPSEAAAEASPAAVPEELPPVAVADWPAPADALAPPAEPVARVPIDELRAPRARRGALEPPAEPVPPVERPPVHLIAPPADLVATPPAPRHFYVVKEGESFFTISKRLFGTVRYFPEVQKANPDVDPRRLRPGQVVAIPDLPGASVREELLAGPEDLKPKPRKPTVYLARDQIYVIQAGDTLEGISFKYYRRRQKWRHILRANPDLNPKRLVPGKRIVVPALTE